MMDPSTLRYDAAGLLPAIVQDATTGVVLMLGMMNAEAVERTQQDGFVTFWSRSRQCLWTKGETSGNTLRVAGMHADCDADALLIQAIPAGPTCHTGTTSCFGSGGLAGFLGTLEATIERRGRQAGASSYTAQLLHGPLQRRAQKVGEEGVELALALAMQDDAAVISEAADLVYHMAVGLRAGGISFADVFKELARRHRPEP